MLFTQLAKNKFIRSIVIVATGTAGAQAITLAFSPFLARVYGPEAFGILGSFIAIFTILMPLSALSYPISIVLPEKEEDAILLAKLSIITSVILSLFLLILLFLFEELILSTLNLNQLGAFVYAIPISLIFYTFYQILNYWLLRDSEFSSLGVSAVLNSATNNSLKLVTGLFFPYGFSLIILTSINYLTYSLFLNKKSKNLLGKIKKNKHSITNLTLISKKYLDFPFFRTPQLVLNALSNSSPILLLSLFFGATQVGFFTMAWTTTSAPAILIGQSVGSVFYPKIVDNIRSRKPINKILAKVFISLSAISAIPFILIFIFGSDLFSFLFGDQWTTAGVYSSCMSIAIFLGLVHRPCEPYLQAKNKNKIYMIFEIIFLLLSTSLMIMAYHYYGNPLTVVKAFIISKSLYYISLILFSLIDSTKP